MHSNEFEDFLKKYLDNSLHWTLATVALLGSLLNWVVTAIRGVDERKSDESYRVVHAPWHDFVVVEYLFGGMIGLIVVNVIFLVLRDSFGKDKKGLGRKDRKALKKAESKARLQDAISKLEREVV